MSALDRLRSRRALIAELDAQADLINQQRAQLDDLAARLAQSQAAHASARRLAEQRADHYNRVRIQLAELLEDIRSRERGEITDRELWQFIDSDSRAERGEP